MKLFCMLFFLAWTGIALCQANGLTMEAYGIQQNTSFFTELSLEIAQDPNSSICFGAQCSVKEKLIGKKCKVLFKVIDISGTVIYQTEKQFVFRSVHPALNIPLQKMPEELVSAPACVFIVSCSITSEDGKDVYFNDFVHTNMLKRPRLDDYACKPTLDQMAPYKIQPADFITIDATVDSFLFCMRDLIRNSSLNLTNTEALSNLANATGDGRHSLGIVGHGAPGLISTGGGRYSTGESEMLTLGTRDNWLSSAEKLKGKVTTLTFFGCDVGASDAGANFLFYMARLLDCKVVAPTGLLWTNGFSYWLDEGAVWQIAYPDKKPAPIAKPGHTVHRDTSLFSIAYLVMDGRPNEIMTDAISKIVITDQKNVSVVMQGDTLQESQLLYSIDLAHPRHIHAQLPAIQTGKIQITYLYNGLNRTSDYIVYNDRIIQDAANPDYYYDFDSSYSLHQSVH